MHTIDLDTLAAVIGGQTQSAPAAPNDPYPWTQPNTFDTRNRLAPYQPSPTGDDLMKLHRATGG
jgi:hypothetical protein